MPPPTVNVTAAPGALVMELGAVMYRLAALPLPTVTLTATDAPAASNTMICAVPVDTPLMVRVVPLTLAVATAELLLLARYGAVPPPTVNVGVAPTAMVIALGTATYKVVAAAPLLTVVKVLTDAPVASNTEICAAPAATPVMVKVAPLTVTVATRTLLVLAL